MTKTRVGDLAPVPVAAFIRQDRGTRELVEAFKKVHNNREEALVVVVDWLGRTVGMVTPLDLLEAVRPNFLKPEYDCEAYWPGLFSQRCRNLADRPVGEVMRPLVTVDVADTLMRAVHQVRRHRVNTVLVLDGDRVVGTLGVKGLFGALANAVA